MTTSFSNLASLTGAPLSSLPVLHAYSVRNNANTGCFFKVIEADMHSVLGHPSLDELALSLILVVVLKACLGHKVAFYVQKVAVYETTCHKLNFLLELRS